MHEPQSNQHRDEGPITISHNGVPSENKQEPSKEDANKHETSSKDDKQATVADWLHDYTVKKDKMKAQIDDNKSDWEAVAKVVDRLFLVISSLFAAVITAVVLGLLYGKPVPLKSGYHTNGINIVED